MTIDAHQHFWQYDPIRDSWIEDNMSVIRRDFMPADLAPLLDLNSIDGCIAVQADQSEAETKFLLGLAAEHSFIKGVVGWINLLQPDLYKCLNDLSKELSLVGVRHIAQGESDDFLSRKDVQHGIAQLNQFNLTYDILVYGHQLPAAIDLVRAVPEQRYVLDHIAKPKISQGVDATWKRNMEELAKCPNVYCKISGMVTECDGFEWTNADFRPFLDTVVETFGSDRMMYGSDWPVCLLAADYQQQMEIVSSYMSSFTSEEQNGFWGKNAIECYGLSIIQPQ